MDEYINAIGALAESMWLFHRELINVGFNETQALMLTADFMRTTITNRPIKEEN